KIYDIGMSLNYENLREWFGAFYEVILGQKQGPRLGSFIKFYGIKKTISLLNEKLEI
ncbi:MAG: lysine--tRNA ligase, partial [Rickettsiales bacterium]|nr:lysine--tRNA ligase [Rickettsiales bacterium]